MIPADIIDQLRQRDLYELARQIAREYGVTLYEMVGRDRHKGPASARHALWARMYGTGTWSYPRIAAIFGVDHSTVQWAVNKTPTAIYRAGIRAKELG